VTELLAALARATPLLILGLGVLLAFRAGIWNIGAEGQFYAGAIAAVWVGTRWGVGSPFVAFLVVPLMAALAGALWAAGPAYLRARFGVLEVITTIMLNFIAEHLVGLLVHGPLQEAARTYPQSDPVSAAVRLGPLFPGSRVTWALPLAVGLAVLLWWVLARTTWGFALRATGANPLAARVSGRIAVTRVGVTAFLVSGAIAGLAGAAEVTGVTFALYEKLSPGYGYTAIAVALLARLHPLWAIGSALFFGALEAGAAALQRTAGIPSVTVYAVEALIIVALVVVERRARRDDGS
jgi:general nucleoside transport system permease protein